MPLVCIEQVLPACRPASLTVVILAIRRGRRSTIAHIVLHAIPWGHPCGRITYSWVFLGSASVKPNERDRSRNVRKTLAPETWDMRLVSKCHLGLTSAATAKSELLSDMGTMEGMK